VKPPKGIISGDTLSANPNLRLLNSRRVGEHPAEGLADSARVAQLGVAGPAGSAEQIKDLAADLDRHHDPAGVKLAFAQGEPIQVADLREDTPSAANEIVLRAGFRALLVTPLLRGKDIVGMLVSAAARQVRSHRIPWT
jgi:hypothetical protein